MAACQPRAFSSSVGKSAVAIPRPFKFPAGEKLASPPSAAAHKFCYTSACAKSSKPLEESSPSAREVEYDT